MRLSAPSVILAMVMLLLTLGGCYCQVTDQRTGRAYFADRWIAADGYTGPLTFADHAVRNIALTATRVNRIS